MSSGLRTAGAVAAASAATGILAGCAHSVHGHPALAMVDRKITGKASLKAHAAAHGLLAGAAVNTRLLRSDANYARILREQYDLVVAENAMKWGPLRPAPDKYFFDDADALVAFAEQNKMKVRGHNLAWHEALPGWFAGTVNKENAQRFLTDHIATVAGRYKGKIRSWDVVNEAIEVKDGRPDGLRKSPWLELLGPGYIDIAFRAAREADPRALLTYNDYGIEYDNDAEAKKREFILQLLRRMKADNVPLDALGIQSHIKAGSSSSIGKGIQDYIASAHALGLQVFLTELDVNDDELPYSDVAQRDHAIAGVYQSYLDTVLPDPAVKSVLTWGVTDRYTWLNYISEHRKKQPERRQRPLLFDDNYQPKEAFFAMRGSFDRRQV
ncbi:MAG TPA: endo-1,4-beta-xylanase [Terriglobales bacterium]|nr:endo-1,4-beta-xylanase [Terriglobales bacterium]